jgi:hypothetical protein
MASRLFWLAEVRRPVHRGLLPSCLEKGTWNWGLLRGDRSGTHSLIPAVVVGWQPPLPMIRLPGVARCAMPKRAACREARQLVNKLPSRSHLRSRNRGVRVQCRATRLLGVPANGRRSRSVDRHGNPSSCRLGPVTCVVPVARSCGSCN